MSHRLSGKAALRLARYMRGLLAQLIAGTLRQRHGATRVRSSLNMLAVDKCTKTTTETKGTAGKTLRRRKRREFRRRLEEQASLWW